MCCVLRLHVIWWRRCVRCVHSTEPAAPGAGVACSSQTFSGESHMYPQIHVSHVIQYVEHNQKTEPLGPKDCLNGNMFEYCLLLTCNTLVFT